MEQRLNFAQKYEEIYSLMQKTNHSMSAFEVGKRLGYATGYPVRKVLNYMVEIETAKVERRHHRLGDALYYRLNPEHEENLRQGSLWEKD